MAGLSEVCGTVLFNEVFVGMAVVCVLEEGAVDLVGIGAEGDEFAEVMVDLVLGVDVATLVAVFDEGDSVIVLESGKKTVDSSDVAIPRLMRYGQTVGDGLEAVMLILIKGGPSDSRINGSTKLQVGA